ncbi:MAG: SDR family oxidoreductase [Pseudomonadota bacterium]|nr:SDR family oxidoreductase [Pseudomonadota bacterium]
MTSQQENKLILCGCGWLGGYLASHFRSQMTIYGTTRSEEKARALSQQGIQAIPYSLGDNPQDLLAVAPDSTFVLNIPPGRRNTDLSQFTSAMQELISALYNQAPPKQLIFISTTSVYGDQEGDITTSTAPAPNTASGEAHVEIEQWLQNTAPDSGYILRLAGLTGPDRHPVKTLAGRTLSGATQVVNLVHVDDVVKVIEALLVQKPANKLWHLCSDEHPMRGDYYPQMAKRLGLPAVEFSDQLTSASVPSGKHINPGATLTGLGITLNYPTPWTMQPA